jgi:hypothetical protein
LVVVLIGAVVQVWSLYVATHPSLQIELSPMPSQFSLYLPDELGEPLQARPRLWLSSSNVKCNANSSRFDAAAQDCPSFSERLSIGNGGETVYISVNDAMEEMRRRLIRVTAASVAANAGIRAPGGSESATGEDQ